MIREPVRNCGPDSNADLENRECQFSYADLENRECQLKIGSVKNLIAHHRKGMHAARRNFANKLAATCCRRAEASGPRTIAQHRRHLMTPSDKVQRPSAPRSTEAPRHAGVSEKTLAADRPKMQREVASVVDAGNISARLDRLPPTRAVWKLVVLLSFRSEE